MRHGYTVQAPRIARSEGAAALSKLMTTARRASGVDEKERRRHELKEQYKQFLRSTDHVAVAALWYPGGVCGLIVARETAVELLVQLMRSEGRAS